MARPVGSQNKDKPFRDALRMEALLADQGEDTPAKPGSLRYIARQLLIRAGPVQLQQIERVIVKPGQDQDQNR
jgi:hypothetical protein